MGHRYLVYWRCIVVWISFHVAGLKLVDKKFTLHTCCSDCIPNALTHRVSVTVRKAADKEGLSSLSAFSVRVELIPLRGEPIYDAIFHFGVNDENSWQRMSFELVPPKGVGIKRVSELI